MSFGPSGSLAGLAEYLDMDQIPRELGGQSPEPLGGSRDEAQLYHDVARINRNAGLEAAQVLPEHAGGTTGWLPPDATKRHETMSVDRGAR